MAEGSGSSSRRIIIFTPSASADRLDIFVESSREWGLEQAQSYSDKVSAALESLREHPFRAPKMTEYPGLRSHLVRWKNAQHGHRIIFEVTANEISIVRILHTAMDVRQHLNIVD